MTLTNEEKTSNYTEINLPNLNKLDDESKKLIVHTKIIELLDNPVSLLNRVKISKYFEQIVEIAEPEDILAILKHLFSDFDYLHESDNYHLLFRTLRAYSKIKDSNPNDLINSKVNELMNKLWDSYPQFLSDPRKQNTLIGYLTLASGVYVNKERKVEEITCPLDKYIDERLSNLQKCFLDSKKIINILKDKLMSNFTQYLITILSIKKSEEFEIICEEFLNLKTIFNKSNDDNMPFFLTSPPHCMFVETLIKVCKDEDVLNKIIKEYILPHVEAIAKSEKCSFILGVILNQDNMKIRKKIVDNIISMDLIGKALNKNQHIFIQKLLDILTNYEQKTVKKIYKNVIGQFNDDSNDLSDKTIRKLVGFVLDDKTLPDITLGIDKVSLPGCLIAQKMLSLKVEKNILVDSILDLNQNRLLAWIQHPQLHHVIEAFLTSKFVKLEKKEQIINQVKLKLVQLVNNKFGSRIIDGIWKLLLEEYPENPNLKKEMIEIATILSTEKLNHPSPGYYVARNLRLAEFVNNLERWKSYHFDEGKLKVENTKSSQKRSHDFPDSKYTPKNSAKNKGSSSRKRFWKNKAKKQKVDNE